MDRPAGRVDQRRVELEQGIAEPGVLVGGDAKGKLAFLHRLPGLDDDADVIDVIVIRDLRDHRVRGHRREQAEGHQGINQRGRQVRRLSEPVGHQGEHGRSPEPVARGVKCSRDSALYG